MDFLDYEKEQIIKREQAKRDELKTPDGRKKYINEQVNKLVHSVVKSAKAKKILAVIVIYILGTGLYYAFANLLSFRTIAVTLLILILVYIDKIKSLISKIRGYFKRKEK